MNLAQTQTYVLSVAAGLEPALELELASMGFSSQKVSTGRVHVELDQKQFYEVCLWTRVAARVLLPLGSFAIEVKDEDLGHDAIYDAAQNVNWLKILTSADTFAIRLRSDAKLGVNQQFGTLRIKDAIVDQFNEITGARPDVDKNPTHLIQADVRGEWIHFYLDASGSSLHKRGYREDVTEAPLKENLAAALLLLAGWHRGGFSSFFDPMCGSGTLLAEAYQIEGRIAAGLNEAFNFEYWRTHDAGLWKQVKTEAIEAACPVKANYIGFDASASACRAASFNLERSGLPIEQLILEQRALAEWPSDLPQLLGSKPMIVTNPPYGERLSERDQIRAIYDGLNLKLCSLKTPVSLGILGLMSEDVDRVSFSEDAKTHKLSNGSLSVIFRTGAYRPFVPSSLIENWQAPNGELPEDLVGSEEFVNRLKKNLKNVKKLAKRAGVTNLRVYDADLPNYNLAIDLYGDCAHLQEYAPPKKIDADKARENWLIAVKATRYVLGIDRDRTFLKRRERKKAGAQYERQSTKSKIISVREGKADLYVNLTDFIDTGLFLDHRPLRELIAKEAAGKRVLNLYSYTCAISLAAALGGASEVVSVDLSRKYLDWGRRNFMQSGLMESAKYRFIDSDVFEWIKSGSEQYDLVIIDPPTFSNSKKFGGTFEVQRDHLSLIKRAMNRLDSNGVLYFSNNFRGFKIDPELLERFDVEDITEQTIGFDFERHAKIHVCFKIEHPKVAT